MFWPSYHYKDKNSLVKALQILAVSTIAHIFRVSCSYNSTSRCFKLRNSEIIWNITFNDDRIHRLDNNVILQKKGYFKQNWMTQPKCNRTRLSIQCEIEGSKLIWMYNFQVVRIINSTHTEVLLRDDNFHLHNSFGCHPDHGVTNLVDLNVTATSFAIKWSFYSWDIQHKLIQDANVLLKANDKILRKIAVLTDKNTSLNQVRSFQGLESCTKYIVYVEVHYNLFPVINYTDEVHVQTKCSNIGKSIVISSDYVIIAVVCSFLLFSLVLVGAYFSKKRKRIRADPNDIIDVRDIGQTETNMMIL